MKVLISADIHINDYADYNFRLRSRLDQFNDLSLRLIEIGKQYNCQEHWILGDLVDKPNSRKYIENVAKNFIDEQSSNFDVVRFIYGQHDLSAKAQDIDVKDTLMGLFDHSNLIYMDHKILSLDGHLFGFMNWRPYQDLEWLGDMHLDVLFGHYTKSTLFGQDIDDSKFDLMIHGDIHNDQELGKFISVGNPIQKDLNSMPEGSVLIFDTETLEWTRVRVDEDHTRFLRIQYTEDPNDEGFHGELQYNVYKPPLDVGEVEESKSITWNSIEELIVNTCDESGLSDIHDEVKTKCKPYSEIDFNFQLKRLSIRGYRSVTNFDIDFQKGDRIALLGANGSGKSSILGALQGVFLRSRYIKEEQSDFTDEVTVTLSLVYQNKLFEITKGSEWRLVIDGSEQQYNNQTEFEDDLRVKLPFIDYVDLFFVRSSVSNLSNQFDSNRRIELISRFYRLDRINAYYDTACELWTEQDNLYWEADKELNTQIGILNHIKTRLEELKEYKDMDKSQLKSELNSYTEMQEQHQNRQLWLKDKSNKNDRLNELQATINSLKSKLTFDVDKGKSDLVTLIQKAEDTNKLYEATYQDSVNFEAELKEISELEKKGPELNNKLEKLKSGICPDCGNKLSTGSAKVLIEKLESELATTRDKWSALDDKLESRPRKRDSKDYYIKLLRDIKSSYDDIQSSIELLRNKINTYNIHQVNLLSETEKYDKLEKDYDEFIKTEPKEVQLPLEISKLILEASSKISRIEEYEREVKAKENQEAIIKQLEDNKYEISEKRQRYDDYSQLTSSTGIIYREILKRLAVKFSTNKVKYEVDSGVYRNKPFINFNSYYWVKSRFKEYEKCSDGQKIICDLDFFNRLFSVKVGLLVLDEYLKHLDGSNFSDACEIIKDMDVNTIIISTHDDNMTAYTRRILLELDESGRTKYSL